MQYINRWWAVVGCIGLFVGSASSCPLCGRGRQDVGGIATTTGSQTGSQAYGFAAAGVLLLSVPLGLAGVYGLLLCRTLSSAIGPPNIDATEKESE